MGGRSAKSARTPLAAPYSLARRQINDGLWRRLVLGSAIGGRVPPLLLRVTRRTERAVSARHVSSLSMASTYWNREGTRERTERCPIARLFFVVAHSPITPAFITHRCIQILLPIIYAGLQAALGSVYKYLPVPIGANVDSFYSVCSFSFSLTNEPLYLRLYPLTLHPPASDIYTFSSLW